MIHYIPVFEPAPSSDACVVMAAKKYDVAPDLLLAIRTVEGGTPGRPTLNTNGTHDFNEPGLNTSTVDELSRRGWDSLRLKLDPCYSMQASAYWLRVKLLDSPNTEPLLARAARYNSGTPQHNLRYQTVLTGPLKDWSCVLHKGWKLPIEGLFAVASKVVTEEELRTCQPKNKLL